MRTLVAIPVFNEERHVRQVLSRVLAHNDLGDASVFNASPAVSDGQLLLRSNRFLYCLGK